MTVNTFKYSIRKYREASHVFISNRLSRAGIAYCYHKAFTVFLRKINAISIESHVPNIYRRSNHFFTVSPVTFFQKNCFSFVKLSLTSLFAIKISVRPITFLPCIQSHLTRNTNHLSNVTLITKNKAFTVIAVTISKLSILPELMNFGCKVDLKIDLKNDHHCCFSFFRIKGKVI